MVVRLYYLLGDSNVEVHYVIKVEDNYIPFDKYGRDEFGNPTEDFADVELDDVTLTGKIGTEFTTKYREVKDYTFVGLYEGNIINNYPYIHGKWYTFFSLTIKNIILI